MNAYAASLVDWIDLQSVNLGSGWLGLQERRKRDEAEFHDAFRRGHRNEVPTSFPNQRFYEAAAVVDRYIKRWIRINAPNGRGTFLDYACGHGEQAIQAAKTGADLAVGIDISETSVSNARENAVEAGVSDRTRFLQRDCEDTGLPAASFSAAICKGMLHHVDLDRAYPELARLMAPSGRILCIEALAYNPFIQAYRRRTPYLRTGWEERHIIGFKEVRRASPWFRVENVKFFLMAAPLGTLFPFGAPRRIAIRAGEMIDAVVTKIPLLRLWSWQFGFELVRTDD